MIRRRLLTTCVALLVMGLATPTAIALAAGPSRAALDPWQREFLLNAFGSLDRVPSWPAAAVHGAGAEAPTWSELGPPVARAGHAGVYDPRHHQVVLFGGTDGANRNDVWSLRLSDTTFVKFRTLGTPPSPRVGHSMVYDSLEKRVIVFGGWDGEYRSDLWELSLVDSTWSPIAVPMPGGGAGPDGRAAHTAVLDPAGRRMIVYGGWNGTTLGDAWSYALDAGVWTQLQASGSAPQARYGHSAVWDDSLARVLVFGGEWRNGETYEYRNDVWELSLSGAPAWAQYPALQAPPDPRYAHSAILDPRGDKMIVFGGYTGFRRDDTTGVYRGETWELSLVNHRWTRLTRSTNVPAARANHTAVYDTLLRRMLIVWGWGDGQPRNDQHAMTTITGDWALLSSTRRAPSARYGAALVHDAPNNRFVIHGGTNGNDHLGDVWWFPLAGTVWQQLTTAGTPPSDRSNHAAVLDSIGNQMIVMGGRSNTYGHDDIVRYDDLWALRLGGISTWTEIVPQSAPRDRFYPSVVFDPVRRRAILFGGVNTSLQNDTWVLDLVTETWSKLAPVGTPPLARADHAAIYDVARDRMIVFGGGTNVGNGVANDVWELSFAGTPRWTQLTPSGTPPSGRYKASLTYDPVRSRALLIAGHEFGGTSDEVWELTLAGAPQWNRLTPSGGTPPARADHSAVHDPFHDRILVFGGAGGASNDLWQLSLGTMTWQSLMPNQSPSPAVLQPNARAAHVAVLDSVQGRMVMFGGVDADTVRTPDHTTIRFGIVWALDLTTNRWSVLDSLPGAPVPYYQRAIVDPTATRMHTFGTSIDPTAPIETKSLSLGIVPEWSDTQFQGRVIPPRFGHGMAFDPIRRQVIVFGGDSGGPANDVWTLELANPAWSRLEAVGAPPAPRQNHTVTYDQTRHRLVVFGGHDSTGALNDLWALSLDAVPTWTALGSTGAPPARHGHTASYDRERDRMIVVGGWSGATTRDDVWELALANAAWTQVQPAGAGIVPRAEHTAMYDPIVDRLVVLGGYGTSRISGPRNDLWMLTWPAGTTAPGAAAVAVESEPGMLRVTWQIEDAPSSVARVYRSIDGSPWTAIATLRAETGRLVFADREVPPSGRVGYRLGLLREGGEALTGEIWTAAPARRPGAVPVVFPSPARGHFSVSFTLPDTRPARLDLFDLAGRRVWGRGLESLGSGLHRLAIGDEQRLPAGLYLVKLTHAGTSRTARVVVLD